MSDHDNFNDKVITEFRANNGKVGGYFANASMLLLTSTGAKSGQTRTSPLVHTTDGERIVIVASKGGAPANPNWYHNLLAHPVATVEIGTERFQIRASVTAEPERTRLYAKMVEVMPGFADYERNTSRKIPVFTLERVESTH